MPYTRRGRVVVTWMALPPPNTLPKCSRRAALPGTADEPVDPDAFDFLHGLAAAGGGACDYHAYDTRLIAHLTARAHQSSRRLTDELIETIAESEGAPRAETDIAKNLLEHPIRYSRTSRLYTSKPEWACAMIAAKVPAVVVEQTKP